MNEITLVRWLAWRNWPKIFDQHERVMLAFYWTLRDRTRRRVTFSNRDLAIAEVETIMRKKINA